MGEILDEGFPKGDERRIKKYRLNRTHILEESPSGTLN